MYIIAGPNGAGKTTAAMTVLPEALHVKEFVNADEIARGLSPLNPAGMAIEAGKIMLKRISQLASEGEDFSIETTLASRSYIKLIKECQAKGYIVTLIFFYLNSWELARERVEQRVRKGGHDIPEIDIERRYFRGIRNLPEYINTVDNWSVYDNSEGDYLPIASGVGKEKNVINFELWNRIANNEY
ncbi:MAG TPA: zeta toxin family protein [Puia sp.]|nr:zeta toxin family protein [Puia sp.]